MRRGLITIVGIVVLLDLLYLGASAVWRYLQYLDQPTVQASQLRPLDGAHVYKIILTRDGADGGPYYAIIQPEEPASAASLAWRKIGATPVDLAAYLDRPVRITGSYAWGRPLQAPLAGRGSTEASPRSPDVVIRIRQIEIEHIDVVR